METPSHVNAVKQNGGCWRNVVSVYTLLTSVENEFLYNCFKKVNALHVMAASDGKEDVSLQLSGIRRRISLSFYHSRSFYLFCNSRSILIVIFLI